MGFGNQHIATGKDGEAFACTYLKQHGLQLVEKNYRCRYGEIDLIMLDQTMLVVIEVRVRKNNLYGGALESITAKKQAKIIRTTEFYLIEKKINKPLRFDVVAITGNTDVNWIKNAFQT